MTSVILTPQAKQLFEVHPQQSHPKLSLRRVLYVRLLKWIDKATLGQIMKKLSRLGFVLLMAFAYFLPQFCLGLLISAFEWNGYKIPSFLALLVFSLNTKRIFNFVRRALVRTRGSNQNSYHGLPVGELASFLKTNEAFKRDEAIKTFALSQGQYQKIAEELEKHGVLMRGENNARVMREISMENLVLQLRDNFPLIWAEEHQIWAERTGTFARWTLAEDFKKRKLDEAVERKERKFKRLGKQIQEQASVFEQLKTLSA